MRGRVYRLLELVSEGCLGNGPAHLLVASAAEIGFCWDTLALGWSRLGLILLSCLAGPVQHFGSAVLDAWRGKVAADLCHRIFMVPCSCFTPPMSRKGIMLCSEVSCCLEWLSFGRSQGAVCTLPVLRCS